MLAHAAFLLGSLLLLEDPEPPVLSYVLKDGQTLTGQVLKTEGDRVTMRLRIFDGSAETTRKLSDFTPRSAANIMMAGLRNGSFEDHFRIARFAVEHGLLDVAGTEAARARQAAEKDPNGAAKLAELEKWAADELERLYREALARNDTRKAEHFLKVLMTRVPDQRTDAQKSAMLEELRNADELKRGEKALQQTEKANAAAAKDQERLLAPIRKDLEAGKKLAREALVAAKRPGEALQKLEAALDRYKAAWKAAEKVQKDPASDPAAKSEAGTLAEQIVDNAIDAALSAAHVLTSRSDYKKAAEYVNMVLAFDPDNADAKELRRTIELASASGWGWGWNYGK